MTQTPELKACPNPWCASHDRRDPELFELHKPIAMDHADHPGKWVIACPVCPIGGPPADTPDEAADLWNTRTDPERDALPRMATVPEQIATVMAAKWLDPECGEGGCQSLVWKNRYESAVNGRQDFRQALRDARAERDALQARVDALVEAFTPDVRAVLDQLTDGEVVYSVDQIAADATADSGLMILPQRAGRILKALNTLGIVNFGPLFAEQETANLRGSGYWAGPRADNLRKALAGAQ